MKVLESQQTIKMEQHFSRMELIKKQMICNSDQNIDVIVDTIDKVL
jgi:hypothetical protein